MSFIDKIREKYDTKTVHLILDQSGYNRSLLLPEHASKLNIKLHFLPPYSPNLNPIERLWKVMNEKVRNNRFFKGAKDFAEHATIHAKPLAPHYSQIKNPSSLILSKFLN